MCSRPKRSPPDIRPHAPPVIDPMGSPVRDSPAVTRRVSVVIPAYNYGRYLEDCVRSVLDQHGVDVDVLILDDASTDDTAARATRLASRDHRVRVILHVTNRGHIATFNEGLFTAEGEYVVLLDADDLLPPGSLARATALLEAHPEVGLVFGRPLTFEAMPPRPTSEPLRGWTIWEGHEWIRQRCLNGANPIATPEVVMRTSVMRETGGMKPSLPHTGDFELWMQLAARASVGRVNGPPQGLLPDAPRKHAADDLCRRPGRPARPTRRVRLACSRDLPVTCATPMSSTTGARQRLASQALDRACSRLRPGTDGPGAGRGAGRTSRSRRGPTPESSRGGERSSAVAPADPTGRGSCRRSWRARWFAGLPRS